jgi:HD superfamily phosphohydrolase
MGAKVKLFRDPVHGYIEVDKWMCDSFIDTELFQRLRFVEQSSMRLLFPGARHDRFIHSLGVYLMAKRIFTSIEASVRVHFDDEKVREFKNTFFTAAILHDCAHSPFSHTGESLAKLYCHDEIVRDFCKGVESESFRQDIVMADCATHEMASAYIALQRFSDVFPKYSINGEQVARMIMGVKNDPAETSEIRFFNCLIALVNGFIVDVDRLDYLERDTWATGIRNASVDLERLISGIDIDFDSGEVRIKQKALSSLINAVNARDYLYQWVIPHHKVAYANAILVLALEQLITRFAEITHKHESDIGFDLFSPDRLLSSKKVKIHGEVVSFPTDGDFLYLMKKYIPRNEYLKAYSERKKNHVSLWKTHAEFMNIFPCRGKEVLQEDFWSYFYGQARNICQRYNAFCTEPSMVKVTKGKLNDVSILSDSSSNEIFANANYNKLDLGYLFCSDNKKRPMYYMNAYIQIDNRSKAIKLIDKLRRKFVECIDTY